MRKGKNTKILPEDVVPKRVWDYDIEQYPNFFLAIFKDINSPDRRYFILYYDTRKDEYSRNDLEALYNFLDREVQTLIGYNNHNYDDLMLKHLLINREMFTTGAKTSETVSSLKRLNDRIINQPWMKDSEKSKKDRYINDLKRRKDFDSIDLFSMSNIVDRVSLKQIAINLKWHNILDLPYDVEHIVVLEEIDIIVEYCNNDVDITEAYRIYKRPDIEYRNDLSKLYGINVMSSNNTNITKRILQKFYCEAAGVKFEDIKDKTTDIKYLSLRNCISPKIRFATQEYQLLLNTMRNYTDISVFAGKSPKNKKLRQFIYEHKSRCAIHTIALGGIHSNNEGEEYKEDDSFEYIDIDVDSFYPVMIINEGLYPRQLGPLFTKVYKEKIVDMRLKAKADVKAHINVGVNSIINESLKNTANGTFGLTKSQFTPWLYDPRITLYITISGQLFLLMLMERIEELTDSVVIYSNTDGLTAKVPKNSQSKADFLRVCKQWEKYTGFTLEYNNYMRMIIKDVSNYLMITNNPDKEYKEKGLFVVEKKMSQGYKYPIVAKALYAYYIHGINVETYIKSQNDIFEFMAAERTSTERYDIRFHTPDDPIGVKLQKSNRWIVTDGNPNEGRIIKYGKKINKWGDEVIARIDMQKGFKLTVLNNMKGHTDITREHINYTFYMRQCLRVIRSIQRYKDPPKEVVQTALLL